MTLPAASSRCGLCLPSAHPLRLFMTASDSVCVQQVFPDAEITAQYWSPSGRDIVQIKDAKSGLGVAQMPQGARREKSAREKSARGGRGTETHHGRSALEWG